MVAMETIQKRRDSTMGATPLLYFLFVIVVDALVSHAHEAMIDVAEPETVGKDKGQADGDRDPIGGCRSDEAGKALYEKDGHNEYTDTD